jgi:hypothetical protein
LITRHLLPTLLAWSKQSAFAFTILWLPSVAQARCQMSNGKHKVRRQCGGLRGDPRIDCASHDARQLHGKRRSHPFYSTFMLLASHAKCERRADLLCTALPSVVRYQSSRWVSTWHHASTIYFHGVLPHSHLATSTRDRSQHPKRPESKGANNTSSVQLTSPSLARPGL